MELTFSDTRGLATIVTSCLSSVVVLVALAATVCERFAPVCILVVVPSLE